MLLVPRVSGEMRVWPCGRKCAKSSDLPQSIPVQICLPEPLVPHAESFFLLGSIRKRRLCRGTARKRDPVIEGVAHPIARVAHPFYYCEVWGGGSGAVLCPITKRSVRHAPRASRTYEDVSRTVTRGDGCQPTMREWQPPSRGVRHPPRHTHEKPPELTIQFLDPRHQRFQLGLANTGKTVSQININYRCQRASTTIMGVQF
jgi:hypothetical protein